MSKIEKSYGYIETNQGRIFITDLDTLRIAQELLTLASKELLSETMILITLRGKGN